MRTGEIAELKINNNVKRKKHVENIYVLYS